MITVARHLAVTAAAALLAGCSQTLETGYVPRALNSNEADRKAYYAPAFSQPDGPKKSSGTGFGFNP